MKTTLNKLAAHHPCEEGALKLGAFLGKTEPDDDPLTLRTILEALGLEDALWCLRAVEGHTRELRLYAVWCARQVQHLMKPRSIAALDTAERYANGLATDEELQAAARSAAWFVAADAARDAAWAADAAAAAAVCAAAWAAASAAAWAAAQAVALDAQTAEFTRLLDCIDAGEEYTI